MEILFERSFARDLRVIRNEKLRGRIAQIIEDAQNASELAELKQITKLKGHRSYYRIRVVIIESESRRLGTELSSCAYSTGRIFTASFPEQHMTDLTS